MVLLVHPGGPFWRNKDRNSWSIPKGEFGDDETAEAAAVREFEEQTGFLPLPFSRLARLFRREASGLQRLLWPAISTPPVSRADPAKSNGHLTPRSWPA
jgi:predicted NUDIX family NTP pyrophosphohydrolase